MTKIIIIVLVLLQLGLSGVCQTESGDTLPYVFSKKVDLEVTSVKNQYRSGTCWAFSGLSFLESELLRMGKGSQDLSEMWLVAADYHLRAVDYVRWQGAKSFSGGAESNNVMDRIHDFGIVPESVYHGLNYGTDKHVHSELDALLNSYVNTVVENNNRKLSTAWLRGYDGIIEAYLGEKPETFDYNGKTYTPKTFQQDMGIIPTYYIEIGAFTHHPVYSKFVFEIPDNWSLGSIYNVKLDEMLRTAYFALDNGYTILWGSDVSEKGFSHKKGVAIVPEDNINEIAGSDRAKWEAMNEKERKEELYAFDTILQEKKITPEIRQIAFDNYETTDDHGMHITGYSTDQNGNKYFKVKNSWGTDNPFNGYFYASEAFFLYKTLTIMIHKDAIPKDIKKNLGIKK